MALTKDISMVNNFKALDQQGKVMAEYVWIGGSMTTGGMDLRSKTKTLSRKPTKLSDLPIWNYDGSSTCQAEGHFSEVLMIPVAMFPDPFRGGDNLLVLCETEKDGQISAENFRRDAKAVFDTNLAAEPWFGIEQEYTLFEKDGRTPLGWPSGGYPGPQGPYYCGAGTDCSFGRAVSDAHYACCLHAGLCISGTNAEVMAGQWEYQIGPCTGIESGDHLWMSRYLLIRVCEMFDVNVTFDPKPMPGDWNGAGCHTNYSTAEMRAPGGYDKIIEAVERIGAKHKEHLAVYGSGNERRLTGAHETANLNEFKYGVSDRGASIRIPTCAKEDGCGYLEDRRPASNIDPYIVTAKIFDTTVAFTGVWSKGVAKFSSVDLADLNLDMSKLAESNGE